MTPADALRLIDGVLSRIRLSRAGHTRLAEALQVVADALADAAQLPDDQDDDDDRGRPNTVPFD
jgi:hypothetical protein